MQSCDEPTKNLVEQTYEYTRVVVTHQLEKELVVVVRTLVAMRMQEERLLLMV